MGNFITLAILGSTVTIRVDSIAYCTPTSNNGTYIYFIGRENPLEVIERYDIVRSKLGIRF